MDNSSTESSSGIEMFKESGNVINNNAINDRPGQMIIQVDGVPIIESKNNKKNIKLKQEDPYNLIINHLETLLKKTDRLQKEVDFLKVQLKGILTFDETNLDTVREAADVIKKEQELQTNATSYRDLQNIKKVLSILSSKSKKKSVSINEEIEKQIEYLVSKYIDTTPSGSETINLGLMLALLKNPY